MHKIYVVKYANGLYEARLGFATDLHKARLFDSVEWAKDAADTHLRAPLAFGEIAGQAYEIIEVCITEADSVYRA